MAELVKRSVKGSALTWAEMDENWQKIQDFMNAVQGAAKSVTVSLTEGENVINHAIGRKARVVTFFSGNMQIEYEWRRHEDADNKIIVVVPEGTPARELTNTEINIITI